MATREIKQEPVSPLMSELAAVDEWSRFNYPAAGQRTADVFNVKYKQEMKEEKASTNPETCQVLKDKIISRRRAKGEDEFEELFEKPKVFELTKAEVEKRERRKEQNRRAATKCRQRKRNIAALKTKEAEEIKRENKALHKEIPQLHEEIARLKIQLKEHCTSGTCRLSASDKSRHLACISQQTTPKKSPSKRVYRGAEKTSRAAKTLSTPYLTNAKSDNHLISSDTIVNGHTSQGFPLGHPQGQSLSVQSAWGENTTYGSGFQLASSLPQQLPIAHQPTDNNAQIITPKNQIIATDVESVIVQENSWPSDLLQLISGQKESTGVGTAPGYQAYPQTLAVLTCPTQDANNVPVSAAPVIPEQIISTNTDNLPSWDFTNLIPSLQQTLSESDMETFTNLSPMCSQESIPSRKITNASQADTESSMFDQPLVQPDPAQLDKGTRAPDSSQAQYFQYGHDYNCGQGVPKPSLELKIDTQALSFDLNSPIFPCVHPNLVQPGYSCPPNDGSHSPLLSGSVLPLNHHQNLNPDNNNHNHSNSTSVYQQQTYTTSTSFPQFSPISEASPTNYFNTPPPLSSLPPDNSRLDFTTCSSPNQPLPSLCSSLIFEGSYPGSSSTLSPQTMTSFSPGQVLAGTRTAHVQVVPPSPACPVQCSSASPPNSPRDFLCSDHSLVTLPSPTGYDAFLRADR